MISHVQKQFCNSQDTVLKGHSINPFSLFLLRLLCGLLSIGTNIFVLVFDPNDFVYFFTNWGAMLTALYYIYVILYTLFSNLDPQSPILQISESLSEKFPMIPRFKELARIFSHQKLVVFLYEVSWAAEFSITFCHWITFPFITRERTSLEWAATYIVHLLPFILLTIELLFCSMRFDKTHLLYMAPLYFVYGVVCYLYTKLNLGYQISVYPGVTWDNLQTIGSMLGVLFFSSFGFFLGYLAQEHKREYRRKFQSMQRKAKSCVAFLHV